METARLLADADYIITYNGRHFDVPFMEKRAKHHGLTFDAPYDLDLYQVISGHSPLREVLPSLKQKNVEIYMGLASGRDDEISGKESVELYHRYMATHSLALERKILLHNHDDLIQLYRLLPVIAKTDFHKAMFKMGFPAGNFSIEKISTEGYDLCVAAKQLGQAQDYLSFPTERQPYTLSMSSTDQRAQLRIPCECQAGAIFFDARGILGRADERIEKYPSVVDGYLIVSDHGIINHMEIATFVKVFFDDLSATFPSIF
jgi:hypothetical protein